MKMAASYSNLGLVLRDQDELQQAKECHERALAISLQLFVSQNVDVTASYNNLGVVLRDQAELQQAKVCHERALAIRLQTF